MIISNLRERWSFYRTYTSRQTFSSIVWRWRALGTFWKKGCQGLSRWWRDHHQGDILFPALPWQQGQTVVRNSASPPPVVPPQHMYAILPRLRCLIFVSPGFGIRHDFDNWNPRVVWLFLTCCKVCLILMMHWNFSWPHEFLDDFEI